MASKYDLFKYVYDNAEDKNEILNQFSENIREDMKKSLDTGDVGLFEQLMTPTTLSEEGPSETAEVPPAPACVESATLPEGDVTDIAQSNLEVVDQMNEDVHAATDEEIEALPEDIQEGVGLWRDASEDMSKLIIMATHNALKGSDFSEEQVLCTGATIAKDLQESGYGKTSLNRAAENIEAITNAQALDDLYSVRAELDSLRNSAEELVDYISDKDNLGLTPSSKEELVNIILENGIFTDDPDHDVREDVEKVIETSGDYSAMDASVKQNLLNDFSGYEFSMEECEPFTCDILSINGSFDGSYNSVNEAIELLEEDFAASDPYKWNYKWGKLQAKTQADNQVRANAAKLQVLQNKNAHEEAMAAAKNKSKETINAAKLQNEVDLKTADRLAAKEAAKADYRLQKLNNTTAPQGFFKSNYQTYNIGPIEYGKGYKSGFERTVTGVTSDVTDFLDKRSERMTKLATAQAKADAKVKVAQAKALSNMARHKGAVTRDAVGLAYAQNAYPMIGNFSEENDATEDQVLMQNEALEALVSKYTMLPTLEAKNAMVEDALAHGVPQEYINAMIERSKGEFSEDEEAQAPAESGEVEAPDMGPEEVLQTVESLGSDEIAQDSEVASQIDPIDGTLPAGDVVGEGATQEEMVADTPCEGCAAEDDSFESIV